MNKNLRRILPLLLGLLLIASLIWYLCVYDREFARDLLMQQARFFENRGDHSVAAWLYDAAYSHSGGDEKVAIELAQHFKENGNYTQAEVTLSKAIAEGGSEALYIALCKTYVEQDKLLDAVAMLDNIASSEIRAKIADLRPAAPATNTAPGFYSQYMTVHLTSGGGNLYITTDGSYPSTHNGPSDGIIELIGGENTVYALSVGENGLVSPLAIFGYTISGVIEQVEFTDPAFNAAVRKALGVSEDALLYSSDLWSVTELTVTDAGSFQELSYLPYLKKLTIEGGTALSLEGLSALSSLTELTVRNLMLSNPDLLTVAALPNLQKLTLNECGIATIANLAEAEHLTYLDLSHNSIQNFTSLSFLSGLTYLDVSHNGLTSLNALSGLSSLQVLKASHNALTTVAPVAGCIQLKELDVSNNAIETLAGLGALTGLEALNASFNALVSVQPLTDLTKLTTLNIGSNLLTDITGLSSLTALQFFDFSRNQVAMLPNWGKNSALITIDGSNNLISSLASLSYFGSLNYVLMDYNNISSVNGLATCPDLIKVSVYGNPVTDVSALTEQSIIVNYNPLG